MPAQKITLLTIGVIAAVAIAENQAVTAAGAIATAAGNAIGFASTAGSVGQRVPVAAVGTAVAIASAAIVLGAAVEVAAAGKVATRTAGVTVGRALNAAAADGDLIEILLITN